ncbi:hypothetical protein [Pollutimonas subterranea]|uniref:hypothetical protein n=1 Tax=Pollutimonas subterranea TaxID=2045210 RepID=UPI001304217A|nr:hypothetical protein [Pollutimonas subterranea]
MNDASGTATFVTEFGSIPVQWSGEGEAVARRQGDKLTLALTGELLLTAPGGQEFSITPSDLLRLRDGLGDTGELTLDDIKDAAAPLIQFLAARGIDATGASLDGETLSFSFDISDAAALPPNMSLTEAFTTNATIDLTVVAQVMKNLVIDLVTTEGAINLGTDFPIGQFLQEVIIEGGGTLDLGPISIDAEGSSTFDVSTLTADVDADIVIDAGDSDLPGWAVMLGGGDDSISLRVESDDGVIDSGASTNRQIDLGAGDNTLYLTGGLGVTIEAGKGDNWIQFTEQVSNLVDVGSEEGIRASVINVRDFSTGDELAFGQHADAAGPRELTGPVIEGERMDVTVDANADLLAKLQTAAANVDVDGWTAFQHEDDTFIFVQNGTDELETGDGLIQLVGYSGELNDSNFVQPVAA